MMDGANFSEDEFILDSQSHSNLPESSVCEMPSSYKRKKSKKKMKKSKRKKSGKKKNSKKNKGKRRSKRQKTAPIALEHDKNKTKLSSSVHRKMKSMALIDPLDEEIPAKTEENNVNDSLLIPRRSPSSVFDEIISNQEKLFDQPNSINQQESSCSNKRILSIERPSNSGQMATTNTADVNAKPFKWQTGGDPQSDSLKNIHLPNSTTQLPIRPQTHFSLPQQQLPMPQPQFLMQSNANLALIGGMSMLKGPNQLLNGPIPFDLFNNIGGHPPRPPLNNQALSTLNSQQHNLFQMNPHLIKLLAAGCPQNPIGLDEALLEKIAIERKQQQQQECLTPGLPLPVPPPPLPPPSTSTSNIESFMIPPPPPPPQQIQSNSRCGLDSPMDVEEEGGEEEVETDDKKPKELKNKRRSRSVQIADELMKKSLKPYFARKKITKDEYKDIMKRGVAKLSKLDSLRPEKVENFVAKYVSSVRKGRGGGPFR